MPDLAYHDNPVRISDLMTDRQGRSFSSHDRRRSAMEDSSDPLLERQSDFVATILNDLRLRYARSEFNWLMIVAEPRMLANLRKHMPPELAKSVVGEAAKDLTKIPNDELLRRVLELWSA